MKQFTLLLFVLGALIVAGCEQLDLYHDETLHPQLPADVVKIETTYGHAPLAVTEITDPARIERLIGFINALPNKWGVPWEGAPAGNVYFKFYRNGAFIGNFYVGPHFFGRDQNNHFSQPATEIQIRAVGNMAGFDLWEYVQQYAPKKTP